MLLKKYILEVLRDLNLGFLVKTVFLSWLKN